MPSMQQKKVKPLEGVVYLPKSGNIVAVKLASSLYKLSFALAGKMADEIPKDWEGAIIVPVFKKGSRKDCGSYCRGISRLRRQNDLGPITYSSKD